MTDHPWDPATGYCTKCGVLKGWHAVECLATPNVTGFMHRLAKRRMGAEAAGHGLDWPAERKPGWALSQTTIDNLTHWTEPADYGSAPIIVEGFPKPPPESA